MGARRHRAELPTNSRKHRQVGSPSSSSTRGFFFSREGVRLVVLDAPMERIARERFNLTGYAPETGDCASHLRKTKESSPWKGALIGPAPTTRSARPRTKTIFLHVANES